MHWARKCNNANSLTQWLLDMKDVRKVRAELELCPPSVACIQISVFANNVSWCLCSAGVCWAATARS